MRVPAATLLAVSCAAAPLSLERQVQAIARAKAACLEVAVRSDPAAKIRCECRAAKACEKAGLPRLCSFDDLEASGDSYPVTAGRCDS